jgi:signal transduction histidine kinase
MPSAPIPANERARLAALEGYRLLDTLPEPGYDDVAELATFICGTPISLISLVDKDRQWFKAKVGVEASETARDVSFCAHTLGTAETLVVEDTLLDARFAENPLVMGETGIRFYAGAPLVDPSGHVLGTVCVADTKPRVLTEAQVLALEALARQVMQLLESRTLLIDSEKASKALVLSEKLAAVGRLASSMAHEVNNPLEAVTNLLYLARAYTTDPMVTEWLEQADLELRRIGVIVNQTLRFHKQATKARPIQCESLFSTTLNLYEAKLTNAGITVESRRWANRTVECFEGDIRQVLSNLVTNAIDAMPGGGRLLVRSREATDWRTGRKGLVLTVADTGTGIDAETRERLFEAFFSTKGIGGSGLGLWISAEIMQRHKGWIRIRSSQRPGHRGTVVQLFLPFQCGETVEAIAVRETRLEAQAI